MPGRRARVRRASTSASGCFSRPLYSTAVKPCSLNRSSALGEGQLLLEPVELAGVAELEGPGLGAAAACGRPPVPRAESPSPGGPATAAAVVSGTLVGAWSPPSFVWRSSARARASNRVDDRRSGLPLPRRTRAAAPGTVSTSASPSSGPSTLTAVARASASIPLRATTVTLRRPGQGRRRCADRRRASSARRRSSSHCSASPEVETAASRRAAAQLRMRVARAGRSPRSSRRAPGGGAPATTSPPRPTRARGTAVCSQDARAPRPPRSPWRCRPGRGACRGGPAARCRAAGVELRDARMADQGTGAAARSPRGRAESRPRAGARGATTGAHGDVEGAVAATGHLLRAREDVRRGRGSTGTGGSARRDGRGCDSSLSSR